VVPGGTTSRTGDQEVVYAPTALPPGGSCIEVTTAYLSEGAVVWAWDWCNGRDDVGKLVTIDSSFLASYTTQVDGRPAYTVDVHRTSTANNTWTSYLYNYSTHVWDVFYTSSGTFDLTEDYGWNVFEVYSTVNPATGHGYYCTDLDGHALASTDGQVQTNGTWTAISRENSFLDDYLNGASLNCPSLTLSMTHPNDSWVATIGEESGTSTQPTPSATTPTAPPSVPPTTPSTTTPTGATGAVNLARSAVASASYTSPWESVHALNDGIDPPASNDQRNPRWGTWPRSGTQWAALTWDQAQTVSQAQVYFFDDRGGVRLPASWTLQYWDGTKYVDVAASNAYSTLANQYNTLTFTPVRTTRLRVVLRSSGSSSVGLLELRAVGG
jgi:hypothetical protein